MSTNNDSLITSSLILIQNKILKEEDDYGGNLDGYPSSGLFAIFSKPLNDIFRAMKLTSMDISNALHLILDSVNNIFDPKRIDAIRSEYDLKKSKILTQWKPIVKNSLEAIQTADPFVTLALSPHLFTFTKTLPAAIAAGKTTAEILAGEEWDGIRSKINRYPDLQTGMRAAADATRKNADAIQKLTNELQKLFYGKSFKNESVLLEQKEKVSSEDLKNFFEESGISSALRQSLSEVLKIKTETIKQILPNVVLGSELLKLRDIKNVQQFKKEIENLNIKENIKKDALVNIKKFISQIEHKAKDLSKDSKFREELINNKSLNIKENDLTDELSFQYASNVVFEASKLKFDNNNVKQVRHFVKWIKQNKDIFVDNKDIVNINKQKDKITSAEDFVKIYTKFISAYKSIENT